MRGREGGVLELLKHSVDLERFGKGLRALGSEAVVIEAANKDNVRVSAAADTLPSEAQMGRADAPERRKRLVDLESFAQLDDALSRVGAIAILVEAAEPVVVEAADEGGTKLSAAADSSGEGEERRT